MHESCEISGEDVLREILDICTYSLREAHESHRLLTVCPDLSSSSPVASPFVLPKVQRGRPKKRGAFSGGTAHDSRKRCSYVPVTVSTSLGVSHSPTPLNTVPANVGVPDTPQTWDSSLSIPEFQDTTDPNTMQLDPESTDTKNPFLQALGKIQDICASTLRMSNGNDAVLLKQEMIPVGPKTKHCKPRRRGGTTGYLVGASAGSYFPCTSEPSSPTQSASLKPDDSPSQPPHDIPEQDIDPFVTPLTEVEDNLQSEMIELDTITGSREPSPSTVDPSVIDLPCDPQGHHNSVIMSKDVETNISVEDNAQTLTESDDTAQRVTGEKESKPDSQHHDVNIVEPHYAEQKVSSVCLVSNEAVTQVDGSDNGFVGGDGDKRKEQAVDEVGFAGSSHTVDTVVSAPDPFTGHANGKSLLEPLIEGESQVTIAVPAAVFRDDVQKKYKRQRRSVPKQ
ncbi:hypothetical protein DH2020_008731 [Rehmannia glutinosa]|uniref:Uncharacterized protein n=1 Tax=Rehmannia glutinosa TaxID=99300 RepID=A0ABR0X4A2_REHGL